MARFKLREGYTEKDLGKLVLQIAEANGKSGGRLSQKEKADYQQQLSKMVDPAFAGAIQVVYDAGGVINIVIPWLGGKDYSGNDLANEAMGSIVICGCGS